MRLKKQTKLFKWLLPLMLVLMLPQIASAHDFVVDGIYYNINGNNATVTYEGYDCYSYPNEYNGDVNIPLSVTHNGTTYSVTSIDDCAFYDCSGLTLVTIPNSVTSIGRYAFSDCSGLTSVTIPNSVTSIGESAFSGCSGLTSVTWNPKTCVIVIISWNDPPTIFSECSNINTFIFGDDVENIPRSLCYGLSGLTGELIIPNSVTSIGESAFSGCSGLTSVTIPNSVTTIGRYAFSDCSGLTSVTIPNSVTSIGGYAFDGCSGLTSVTIPNSVTEIGDGAFADCTGLTSVIIPNSVTTIGNETFCNCIGLTSVTIPNSVTEIGGRAFVSCTGLTSVTIPNSVTEIRTGAFSGCSGLTEVTIPNSVTNIYGGAFADCTGLTSVTVGNSVTKCGGGVYIMDDFVYYNVFEGCTSLRSVTWNAKNCSDFLEESFAPFKGFMCITSFKFGNEVERIPAFLCQELTGLTSVTIPNSVNEIGDEAFRGCSKVRSIYSKIEDPESVSYGSDIFYGVNKFHSKLYVPAGTVEDYQFTDPWLEFLNILEEGGGNSTTPVHGDVNGDGVVTAADVTAIYNILLGNE